MNAKCSRGRTCLGSAIGSGSEELITLLIDSGADVNELTVGNYYFSCRNSTALALACERGHLSAVELLLARGADINLGDMSPLTAACSTGTVGKAALAQLKLIKLLLANGADINKVSKEGQAGRNPLMTAVTTPNNRKMITLLLDYGADINYEHQGQCPLSLAERTNIKLLLENGADLFREDGVTRSVQAPVVERGLYPSFHPSPLISEPRMIALARRYQESNKRANRLLKPILK